ncbi:hypothetical protein HYN56_11935 [Flavobacterium crocinum]|uniref:Uncharacterized protein n=1 Tax=Flavobacterium crocinum TaxID=2183896 RepID=A0A2S1YLE5_9FLAO|nr:hypothetical protein HYN56_11935 [Flavobacterium crocinum]
MRIIIRILFFIGVFLFLCSYFITPYTINDGEYIVIDADALEFLKMLYIVTSVIFGYLFFAFLSVFKNKFFLFFSLVFLAFSLIFLAKMFLYFDTFLD